MPSTWNDTIKWTKPIICHYLSCSGHVYVVGVCVCLKTVCLCGADVYWFSQRLLMASNECHWFRQSAVFKWVARTPQRFDCCKHIGYRQEFSCFFLVCFGFFTPPQLQVIICDRAVEQAWRIAISQLCMSKQTKWSVLKLNKSKILKESMGC